MAGIFHPEELLARRDQLRAQYESARSRYAELVDLQKAITRRRAEVRASRMRLRAERAGRLSAHRDRGRAAAAILGAATSAADIPLIELWIDYFSMGGNRSLGDFRATMDGRLPIDRFNHDPIALALNERLINDGFGPLVAYWDSSRTAS